MASCERPQLADAPNQNICDDRQHGSGVRSALAAQSTVVHPHRCRKCGTSFENEDELRKHRNNAHPYCERCDLFFPSWTSRRQHLGNLPDHYFGGRSQVLGVWCAPERHNAQSSGHHYCRKCDTRFQADDKLRRHHCPGDHHCGTCSQSFETAATLRQHHRQSHLYCTDCQRFFMSKNNIREHMNSRVHRPKNVACVFYRLGCSQRFVSNPAMISHLEYGSACVSGIDRDTIRRWVLLIDERYMFTVPLQLLAKGDEDRRCCATEEAWNVYAFECVLCSSTFKKLDDLNRHMASPRHQGNIYRCPLSTCLKTFNTLGGLYRHVESESCGAFRIQAVRKDMDRLLSDMRRMRN